MGCDIHSCAEVRERGTWRNSGRIWADPYEETGLTAEPFSNRSYYTFAILAGVRNRYERITPIADPRGWPVDLTDESKEQQSMWLEADGHSFSWHSLRHLLDYPLWHSAFTVSGVISGPTYAALKKGVLPDGWWWERSFDGTLVDEDQMARELELGNNTAELYVETKWEVPYRSVAEEFVTETIPRLIALASPHPDVLTMANLALAGEKNALLPLQDWLEENERPGLDDVRIVFCFDN